MTTVTTPAARPLPRLLPVLMLTALLATTSLLAVATYDFAIKFRWLAIPPALLFIAILYTGISNTLTGARTRHNRCIRGEGCEWLGDSQTEGQNYHILDLNADGLPDIAYFMAFCTAGFTPPLCSKRSFVCGQSGSV